MYNKELSALKRANRFRERFVQNEEMADFASNDYLGLAENSVILDKTYATLKKYKSHAPKASMLVNGYHPLHLAFEEALCEANNFQAGMIVGSGFLANIAMIEALVRKDDVLFIDEEYHASGMLATRLHSKEQIQIFHHNDILDLRQKLQKHLPKGRIIICVEGIYSMSGDIVAQEIFAIALEYDAILIVDEAHSSGVVGKNLMGVFDLFNITPTKNHIKMGTLGKAYGSYGAYILASTEIISFLENRAKPIIYSTAPSLFDTVAGHYALLYILENKSQLHQEIQAIQQKFYQHFGINKKGLIFPFEIGNNAKVMSIKKMLEAKKINIGAIRQPTVTRAILRVIGRINMSEQSYDRLFLALNDAVSS